MNDSEIQVGLVSTIIPVFNRGEMVIEAIQSVLEQDYRPIEIIVVDDGSTDDTVQALSKLADQYADLRVLSQANAGPGAARELGRLNARGEFIQYLDSDDLLLPNKFSLQVTALDTQLDCDVAYGKTEEIRMGESPLGFPSKGTGEERLAMFPDFLRSRWWSTSTPLFRRAVTDLAGAWLPISNEEDWEYDCRVAALGGRLAFVNAPVSLTRTHQDRLSINGTQSRVNLAHKCVARTAIYIHALQYQQQEERPTSISKADWQFFSKSVFLLARQCAAVELLEQAQDMLELSIRAAGKPNIKHRLFSIVTRALGMKNAVTVLRVLGK